MSELQHYGIQGMKWGVRRYQNEDGTYTDAGKKRAQKQKAENVKDISDEELSARVKRLSLEKTYKNLSKTPEPPSQLQKTKKVVDASSDLVNKAKRIEQESGKTTKKQRMDLSKMTDKEMRDQINRELLERQYNDLFAKAETTSKGREHLSKVLDTAGTVLTVTGSALSIALAIQELSKKGG